MLAECNSERRMSQLEMMEMDSEKYLRLTPRPTRSNPLVMKRTETNTTFIMLPFMVVLVWIGSIIYVFFVDEESIQIISLGVNFSFPGYEDLNGAGKYMHTFPHPVMVTIGLLCIILAIIPIRIFLRTLRYHTEGCIIAALISTILFNIGMPFYITIQIQDLQKPIDYNTFTSDLVSIVKYIVLFGYFLVALNCMSGIVKISDVAYITQNVLRICFAYPSFIFLGLLFCFFQLLIIYLSGKAMASASCNGILSLTILLSGFYTRNFIFYHIESVIYLMTATWHWASENSRHVPINATSRSIFIVTRYHLGSIAYSATIILPICAAVMAAFTLKISQNRIINTFFILYLIIYNKDYALAAVSTDGKNFYQSTKSALQTLTKNTPLSFAFIFMFISTVPVVGLMAVAIGEGPFVLSGVISEKLTILDVAVILWIGGPIILYPVVMVLEPIKTANLLFMMEKDDENRRNYHPNVLSGVTV